MNIALKGLRRVGPTKLLAGLLALSLFFFYTHISWTNSIEHAQEDSTTTLGGQQRRTTHHPTSLHNVQLQKTTSAKATTSRTTSDHPHVAHHHTVQVKSGHEVPLVLETSKSSNPTMNTPHAHKDYIRLLQQSPTPDDVTTLPKTISLSIKSSLTRSPLSSAAAPPPPEGEEDDDESSGTTDPLDIPVVEHWEQITAELWSALSRGSIPALPVSTKRPQDADGEGEGEDEGGEGGSGSAHADKERVKEFIQDATDDQTLLGNPMQHILDQDTRCAAIYNLLKQEIDQSVNTSLLDIGSGTGLSSIHDSGGGAGGAGRDAGASVSSGDPVLDLVEGVHSSNEEYLGEYDPFEKKPRAARRGAASSSASSLRHSKGAARIQGCVGIRSAQNMPKSTVVYVGSTTSDLFGPTFRTSYTALPTTVADVRDALNKRTINHVACASSLTASFLDDVLLDIPETFSYQIWTDLVRMPGMMLPHEFEIYLGKLMSLSITVRNRRGCLTFSCWAHMSRFHD